MAEQFTIIRNGRLVDLSRREAAPADILIEGDKILTIGRAGRDVPPNACIIDASDRAMMPGLAPRSHRRFPRRGRYTRRGSPNRTKPRSDRMNFGTVQRCQSLSRSSRPVATSRILSRASLTACESSRAEAGLDPSLVGAPSALDSRKFRNRKISLFWLR